MKFLSEVLKSLLFIILTILVTIGSTYCISEFAIAKVFSATSKMDKHFIASMAMIFLITCQLALMIPFFGIFGWVYSYVSRLANTRKFAVIVVTTCQILALIGLLIVLWYDFFHNNSIGYVLFCFYVEISGILISIVMIIMAVYGMSEDEVSISSTKQH